jgi:hypothetical protein
MTRRKNTKIDNNGTNANNISRKRKAIVQAVGRAAKKQKKDNFQAESNVNVVDTDEDLFIAEQQTTVENTATFNAGRKRKATASSTISNKKTRTKDSVTNTANDIGSTVDDEIDSIGVFRHKH